MQTFNKFKALLYPVTKFIEFKPFNCYLTVPQPTLGHSKGDSPTNSMLITAFAHC